jgi:hypothetical protein
MFEVKIFFSDKGKIILNKCEFGCKFWANNHNYES